VTPGSDQREMSSSPLSIDVYVAPMRPYACPDQLGEGEVATWAPSSSTLISGPTESDCPNSDDDSVSPLIQQHTGCRKVVNIGRPIDFKPGV
jgi:hypothetical protein